MWLLFSLFILYSFLSYHVWFSTAYLYEQYYDKESSSECWNVHFLRRIDVINSWRSFYMSIKTSWQRQKRCISERWKITRNHESLIVSLFSVSLIVYSCLTSVKSKYIDEVKVIIWRSDFLWFYISYVDDLACEFIHDEWIVSVKANIKREIIQRDVVRFVR